MTGRKSVGAGWMRAGRFAALLAAAQIAGGCGGEVDETAVADAQTGPASVPADSSAPRAAAATAGAGAEAADSLHVRIHESTPGSVDSLTVSRGGVRVQTLLPDENFVAPEPEPELARLERPDVDGDGTGDLALLAVVGAANSMSEYWRMDPARGRFVPLGTRPTLQPDGAPGAWSTFERGGHAGRVWTASRWRWMDGGLAEVAREAQAWDPASERYLRIVHARRGGALAEVSRDTLDEAALAAGPSWMEP